LKVLNNTYRAFFINVQNFNKMKKTRKTAGETAREIVAVCDVFDIAKTKAWYAQRGYQPTGEWHYANRQETIIRVHFARPMVINFSIHDLLDDLLGLFMSGRYSRQDALRCITAIKKGGAA